MIGGIDDSITAPKQFLKDSFGNPTIEVNHEFVNWKHGCQNRDLDRKIARFYDPTSPKCLKLHKDRKNYTITCRIVGDPTDPTKM